VNEVRRTRKTLVRRQAYLKQADGLHPLRITVRAIEELVQVIVEEIGPGQAQALPA
jgi:hypothetical protein